MKRFLRSEIPVDTYPNVDQVNRVNIRGKWWSKIQNRVRGVGPT
ncbi:hypothetical protein Hanom_Chr09g00828731 [Helianthus anomalus]